MKTNTIYKLYNKRHFIDEEFFDHLDFFLLWFKCPSHASAAISIKPSTLYKWTIHYSYTLYKNNVNKPLLSSSNKVPYKFKTSIKLTTIALCTYVTYTVWWNNTLYKNNSMAYVWNLNYESCDSHMETHLIVSSLSSTGDIFSILSPGSVLLTVPP